MVAQIWRMYHDEAIYVMNIYVTHKLAYLWLTIVVVLCLVKEEENRKYLIVDHTIRLNF